MREAINRAIDEMIKTMGAFKASVNAYFEGRDTAEGDFARKKALFDADKAAHESDMKAREEAVKPFEDALAIKKDGEKLISEGRAIMAEASTRINAATAREQEVDRNASERMVKVNAAEDGIKARSEALDRKEAGIEAEVTKRVVEVLTKCEIKKDVIDGNNSAR
jgi:hypothetical protein